MSRVVGIDLRDNHVRVAALSVGYRKLELEGLHEELLSFHENPADALRACLSRLPQGGIDTAVVSVDGARCFVHKLQMPASARKRLVELLPFELEAELPLEIEELLVDHAILPAKNGASTEDAGQLSIMTVAARVEHVQEAIDLVRDATERQPERVGCSTTELAQLVQLNLHLRSEVAVALVDFGFGRTDVCILQDGQIRQARALSLGVEGFPEEASTCVAQLRQTLAAHAAATGRVVERLYIMGEGAQMTGVVDYLSSQLEVSVEIFNKIDLDGLSPEFEQQIPAFGRALGTAMHGVRGKGFDLRQGELAYERGYEHVKERAPLLGGLLAAVLLSFFFATWAESRALAAENGALIESLQKITKTTFGTETADPDEAEMALEKARKSRPEDPMPYLDGFGVAVALSETLPTEVTHDVEEFDVIKDKVKLRGLVDSTEDAQKVVKSFEKHRCIQDPTVTKITQVVNSEKERYTLEAQVHCPEDRKSDEAGKKKSKSGGAK